eukprot:CAMPEP_0116951914 /NCGR_PEP_ID=MMETSP0467-20121206/40413_1 /TAXON_ID=283647 /ORGANISM="Mesodinium pulex, Strain SPMC105" /LENGTH=227 /DNA_ID=CAMNT_0004637071 /DNA_START=170 /DNA_END=855 /DNA_ORIENTATION=-
MGDPDLKSLSPVEEASFVGAYSGIGNESGPEQVLDVDDGVVPVALHTPLALRDVLVEGVEEVVAEDALAQVEHVSLLLGVDLAEVQPVLEAHVLDVEVGGLGVALLEDPLGVEAQLVVGGQAQAALGHDGAVVQDGLSYDSQPFQLGQRFSLASASFSASSSSSSGFLSSSFLASTSSPSSFKTTPYRCSGLPTKSSSNSSDFWVLRSFASESEAGISLRVKFLLEA